MAALTSTVHVCDEHGIPHVFGPGDAVPSWAVSRIDNPKAWDVPPTIEPVVTPKRGRPRKSEVVS